MQTTYSDPEPLNWRTLPIWAIPQLAHIRDTLKGTILSTFYVPNDEDTPNTDSLGFSLYIPGEGTYLGKIYKEDMSNPNHIPRLYSVS